MRLATFQQLCVDNLYAGYGRNVDILHGINLSFVAGERVAVIGPNAAGKSTLLKCLSGELCPRFGQVKLDGTPLLKIPGKKRARILTRVAQNPVVNTDFTVQEYVTMGRYPHLRFNGTETYRDMEAVRQAMEWTGLTGLEGRCLGTLSGGERQRVALAQAIAQETPVLLLDEPNVFLDLHHQQTLLEILDKLHRETGRTIIAALHDLNLALAFAQRVIVLDQGRVAADGPPPVVLKEELIEEVYHVRAARISGPHGLPHFVLLGLSE
ncbi:MAG TPA: ABC transporter ATP-binding protein [Firmicutes bacterium]|jgi:iron complex transport system ATP-binding protein|nr:ABC transporter ATP-binding protein [Bacillota bacterium]HOQ24457.1 ABC transporter ATP-binding protein [Bacillota bacterium]HPT67761.1 ABC transporter ATP-binding protein [Bacillota bacterium]